MKSNPVTLEEVESLVAQLSPADRLTLVARLCDRLSFELGPPMSATECALWADECDEVAALWQGGFDSVADLRRIRDED